MLEVLRGEPRLADWLMDLEAAGAGGAPVEVDLPAVDELPDVLLDLAVPHEDINPLIALRKRLLGDPEARWLLDRSVRLLVRDMGEIGRGPWLPSLPRELGPLGRYLPVYALVAAAPYVRTYHRARGIPDAVARRTLADLGRQIAVHRRRFGTGGLITPGWLALHFRGELYQLGRLQFQRGRLGARTVRAMAAAGRSAAVGEPALHLHICDFRGPLSPAACDESFALAREFFARHFPEERYDVAVCHSWLLDGQLRRYLPSDAHIVRFQERFTMAADRGEPEDDVPVGFVFGDPTLEPAGLPRRSALERAVGDHLRAGSHWYTGHGWVPM